MEKRLGRFRIVFSEEQENELVSYLTSMEGQLFGLTMHEFREVAFQLAEKNGIQHPFGANQLAGQDWMTNFMKRHPALSLRAPEATSAARAMGFNRVVVQKFFDLLIHIIETEKITGDRMFNVDQTGLTVNPKGFSKIIAQKGRRQVGVVTSAERGETVTAEMCFSAAGVYVPPMLIFPRKRMQPAFEMGLPTGSFSVCHESGWITKELFIIWMEHFIKFTGASQDRKVHLILDGHASHTKNIELIDLARENGVILLCFPPHCSRRLQPLDVAFMKPMSTYYGHEVRKFLSCNPGKVVTLHHLSQLFGAAYTQAATMSNAINGFRKTGIYPTNMDVFEDHDFLPSATTDIEISTVEPGPSSISVLGPSSASEEVPRSAAAPGPNSASSADHGSSFDPDTNPEPAPGTSSASEDPSPRLAPTTDPNSERTPGSSFRPDPSNMLTAEPRDRSFFLKKSPGDVIPIPHVSAQSKKRVSKKRGGTAILTSSPYKKTLLDAENSRKDKLKGGRSQDKPEKIEKAKKASLFSEHHDEKIHPTREQEPKTEVL